MTVKHQNNTSSKVFLTWRDVIRGFSQPSKESVIIHFNWLTRTLGLFDVAKLASGFLLFKKVPDCSFDTHNIIISLIGLFCFFTLIMVTFTSITTVWTSIRAKLQKVEFSQFHDLKLKRCTVNTLSDLESNVVM